MKCRIYFCIVCWNLLRISIVLLIKTCKLSVGSASFKDVCIHLLEISTYGCFIRPLITSLLHFPSKYVYFRVDTYNVISKERGSPDRFTVIIKYDAICIQMDSRSFKEIFPIIAA